MNKLYEAYSTVDNFDGRDGVTFCWFVTERAKPVAPYEKLIKDRGSMDEHGRFYTEDFVDELLTKAEVEELREYLAKRHEMELRVEEVELPVRGPCLGFGALSVGGGTDFYMLSKEEGYSLSVPIWGFYDLRPCPDSIQLTPEQMRAAQDFLAKALGLLQPFVKEGIWPVPSPEPGEQWSLGLKQMIQTIYDETGLYVARGEPKEQRLKGREKQIKRIEAMVTGQPLPLDEDELPF